MSTWFPLIELTSYHHVVVSHCQRPTSSTRPSRPSNRLRRLEPARVLIRPWWFSTSRDAKLWSAIPAARRWTGDAASVCLFADDRCVLGVFFFSLRAFHTEQIKGRTLIIIPHPFRIRLSLHPRYTLHFPRLHSFPPHSFLDDFPSLSRSVDHLPSVRKHPALVSYSPPLVSIILGPLILLAVLSRSLVSPALPVSARSPFRISYIVCSPISLRYDPLVHAFACPQLGKRKALLIGVNYIGSSNALGGCIADAMALHKWLQRECRIETYTGRVSSFPGIR